MLKLNTIYNEDCFETMKKMPNNFVDLVITSPPYNMRMRTMNNKYVEREKNKHFSKKYEYFNDAIEINEFYKIHSEIVKELLRISPIVCYNFQIVTGSKEAFFKLIGNFNKYIKDIIVWDKGFGQPSMHEKVLNSCYELILIMESDKRLGRMINNSKFNRGEMDNILRINKIKNKFNEHNASFPINLPIKLINAFTIENDVVYDPFIGTGTTAIAALKNNRQYIGSEIVKEYYDICIENINEECKKINYIEQNKRWF